MIKCLALLVMLLTLTPVHADDEKKYLKFAAELREKVWSDDDPMFKNYTCPQQYSDPDVCSAVILASCTDAEVTRKSFIRMTGLLMLDNNKKLGRHELNRMLIKLNDAAALKKFSEFDYTTFKKSYYKGMEDKRQQVLGVRVIKPDGRIVDVNTDDYMTTREGKKDKDVSHKLAVPGLEVGDILDIFTYDELVVHDRNVPHFRFWFLEEYPILKQKVRCVIDKKFTVQYRTLNGAPDFASSLDDEGNTVLEAEVNNVNKVEPTLWYNPIEQSPVTLLYIFDKSVTNKQMKSVKNRDVQANPDFSSILADDLNFMKSDKKIIKEYLDWPENKKQMKDELATAKKLADKEEAAKLIYTGLLYTYRAFDKYDTYSPFRLMLMMSEMLDMRDIPYQFVVTTDYENEPLDRLIYSGNTSWLIKTEGGTYFAPPTYQGTTAGLLPACFQGRRAAVVNKLKGDKSQSDMVTLPQSTADDNVNQVTVNASIDGMAMDIERTESLTGAMKESIATIMTDEQEFDAYDQYLGRKKPYMERIAGGAKKGTAQKFAKGREDQQDDFKEEIKGYHDQAAASVISSEILGTGINPSEPAFVYKTRYTMDGWVKRAGSNLVVSAGKLIGAQSKVEGSDRRRTFDVNRRCPALVRWNITINVPSGYQVSQESLAKLQQQVKNSAGEFNATASIEGNRLTLAVNMRYNKGDYPASQWQDLLQIIDAADEFTTRQVVFKK